MIIPIRCFSCGKPIAHLYAEYKTLVQDGMTQKEALDKLGIKRYCCRAQILGQTDTLELVNKFKKF
ncbi:DNA-directed RNA polymerase subunit N [archaeon]|nr:DNA-directed RNA polymerase subunit N [archaeon]MBT7128955.1 DNA-directed RNA polymerase subunit N [archaeon]